MHFMCRPVASLTELFIFIYKWQLQKLSDKYQQLTITENDEVTASEGVSHSLSALLMSGTKMMLSLLQERAKSNNIAILEVNQCMIIYSTCCTSGSMRYTLWDFINTHEKNIC